MLTSYNIFTLIYTVFGTGFFFYKPPAFRFKIVYYSYVIEVADFESDFC